MENNDEILNNLSKKIICFGTGSSAENFRKCYPLSYIEFYCDNDKRKQSFEFLGKKVYSPTILKEINLNEFLIVIASMYEKEIAEQLDSMGFKEFDNYLRVSWIYKTFNLGYENGHFYSTVPKVSEIFSENYNWYSKSKDLLGIDLNLEHQQNLFNKFQIDIAEFGSLVETTFKRFTLNNNFIPFNDAAAIYSMLKAEPPKRVIEIGSGYSSAIFLDAKDYLNLDTKFIFIDPYPQRLKSLLTEEDYINCEVIEKPVQSVPPNLFINLEEGDILFIDSSHVSKLESDVNYLLFEIIPLLKKGVRIHFHDIFYPFEYPKEWILQGRFWNEVYLLRAFLQNNAQFLIEYWIDFIHKYSTKKISSNYIELLDSRGGSIWIRKMS